MKGLIILGSTGSIGRQTLDVVRSIPNRFDVLGLAAGRNIDQLSRQVQEFHPAMVYCVNEHDRGKLPRNGWRFASMEEMVTHPAADSIMVGTVGQEGLTPTIHALNAKKNVALANKEVIIMAGGILMDLAQRNGVEILPVDSEPSAMWQCMKGENKDISRLFLTASGGPFRTRPIHELPLVTTEEALNHPTWRMGKKITIDSATLMNKGLEVIEATWLFGLPIDRIEVVLHPQSIIHSMVEFVDGSVKAQLGPPDMRLPIQYSLSYPDRWPNPDLPQLNPVEVGQLTFEPLDTKRYPCFNLALEAGRKGATYPTVLAASDEIAVGLFLSNQIRFDEIPKIIEGTLAAHAPVQNPSLEDIMAADTWARRHASAQTV